MGFMAPVSAQDVTENPLPDATLERYQRKYVSFFFPQDVPLNRTLTSLLTTALPRFDYYREVTPLSGDLPAFLAQVQAFQQQKAGDIAADKEQASARFGDKVITWSETQKIANAAMVFSPSWRLGAIRADALTPTEAKKPGADWYLETVSPASLQLQIYTLQAGQAELYTTRHHSWDARNDRALRVPAEVMQVLAANFSPPLDLKQEISSSDRDKLLGQLRKSNWGPTIDNLERQDPYVTMMNEAVSSLPLSALLFLHGIRQLPLFMIKAELGNTDTRNDRVEVLLEQGEDAQRLGIGIDHGYKVIEKVQQGERLINREVGYLKVRERQGEKLIGQPILVGRPFELGDQVVEHPKLGIGLNLRGGAGVPGDWVDGNVGLDLDIGLGPLFGASEWYLSASGLVLGSFGTVVELGLHKKWFQREVIWALGARAGTPLNGSGSPSGLGGTVWGGLHRQMTPDFVLGVDAGWRYYQRAWMEVNGPFIEGFLRFEI
jgi:hypothetical protein